MNVLILTIVCAHFPLQESDRRADMEKREWWQRRRGPEENAAAPEKEFAPERRMGARRKPHPSQVRVRLYNILPPWVA